MLLKSDGPIRALNEIIARLIKSPVENVYENLENLLNFFIPRKALHEYGCVEKDVDAFTEIVIENQQRLLVNSYVPLTREQIREIYWDAF